jgi:hypothetical protein
LLRLPKPKVAAAVYRFITGKPRSVTRSKRNWKS